MTPAKRNPPTTKKPPAPVTENHPALGNLMLLMINGISGQDLTEAARKRLAIPESQIPKIIEAAKAAIKAAARFDKDAEFGIAYARNNDIYNRAVRTGDYKTALGAQKELSRLLSLHRPASAEPDAGAPTETPEAAELAAIAAHLRPLSLGPNDYPLPEIARLAAERIRDAQAATA